MSKIGCVILNYNDADNTIELVHQIEDYSSIDHIIVVDNASTDDSVKRLSILSNKKVSIHVSPKNGGSGAGNNMGIKIAKDVYKCEFVIISNPDVRFSEECAVGLITFLKEHDNCAIAAPLQLRNGNIFPFEAWELPSPIHYLITSLAVFGKLFPVKYYKLNRECGAVKVDCIAGSFFCINTDMFLSIGGYDENIFLLCEEVVLGLKFKEKNMESYILTNHVYNHYHETGSNNRHLTGITRLTKLLGKNHLYIVQTYMTSSKLTLALGKVIYCVSIIETPIKNIYRVLKSFIVNR